MQWWDSLFAIVNWRMSQSHDFTWLVDTKHTCVLLKSFAGLWRTSNKCPNKNYSNLFPQSCACDLPNTTNYLSMSQEITRFIAMKLSLCHDSMGKLFAKFVSFHFAGCFSVYEVRAGDKRTPLSTYNRSCSHNRTQTAAVYAVYSISHRAILITLWGEQLPRPRQVGIRSIL